MWSQVIEVKKKSITFDPFSWITNSRISTALSRSCMTCRETLQHSALLDQWGMTVSTRAHFMSSFLTHLMSGDAFSYCIVVLTVNCSPTVLHTKMSLSAGAFHLLRCVLKCIWTVMRLLNSGKKKKWTSVTMNLWTELKQVFSTSAGRLQSLTVLLCLVAVAKLWSDNHTQSIQLDILQYSTVQYSV